MASTNQLQDTTELYTILHNVENEVPNYTQLRDPATALALDPQRNRKYELYIRPISWSTINPSAGAIKVNPFLVPSIQMFGYTSDGRSIYVSVPRKSTFVLKFAENIDDEIAGNIKDILNPTYVKVSTMDPRILIVRAPELSPTELTANSDFEEIATWIEAQQDPYGELESFWEATEISPYEWIAIDKFIPLPGKYTSCDLNIISDESYIKSAPDLDFPEIFPRLFFWDLETFASKPGEFPNSSNPNDFIFMVSIITVSSEGSNGYVIVKGDVNTDLINQDVRSMVLVRAKDEKDLIKQFFAIYSTFKPDRQIYYNGDMFDTPYLLDRLTIHDYIIPKITKILSLNPRTFYHQYSTPFGRETARTIDLPGTEIIDLLHYYRRFYPHFKNHRLDTVAHNFLGEGKTDLTIDALMDAIRTNNPDKIAHVVDYSFVDSLRMYQLWDVTTVQSRLETVCNNLGISIDTILRASFDRIIDLSTYNIDAGSAIIGGKKDKPNHLKEAVKGIYRNVYLYDYSELYRQIMLSSEQPIASVLADRLEGAPPQLILSAFYSEYVDRTDLLPLLNGLLESVIGTKMVIALEPTIIRSIGPLNSDWLNVLDTLPCYVSVAKASYLILDSNGEIEAAGLAKLCRPKFELASDIIRQYLNFIYSNKLDQFNVPDLKTLPIEKFILSEKIGNIAELKPETIKYKLAIQHGSDVTTWVTVKYVMTFRGPVLLSLLKPDDTIDYGYYTGELAKYIKDIQSLKIYGI